MSMIREVNELSSIQPNTIEKIKVSSAEILVHGTKEKPYYEIKYRDLSDGQIHEGYGSYNLDYVFEWLEECFEIIPEKDADRMSISEQINELRISAVYKEHSLKMLLEQAADTIEALSAKLQAANCGGLIPCKERLPQKDETVLIDTGIGYFEIATYSGDGKTFYTEEYGSSNAVAWQPLPEPYHEP